MLNVVSFLTEAMKLVPVVIQAGQDIYAFSEMIYAIISNGSDPTPQDWANLKTKEEELRNILQKDIQD